MKHLAEFVYEGIFNVDDNINDTSVLDRDLIENPDSDFWKFMTVCNVSTLFKPEVQFDVNRKELIIPNTSISIDGKVKNPLTTKYDFECGEFYIGNPSSSGPHPKYIDDGAGFKSIKCNRLVIDGLGDGIKGFDFKIGEQHLNISNGYSYPKAIINFAGSKLDIKDTSIEFLANPAVLRLNNVTSLPNLSGIKSNAGQIYIYDPSLFDHLKSDFDNFFGSGEIECNGITKKKNIRNIVAIANNKDKYGSIDPEQIIPVGKLSDLLDIKGFKDLNVIYFSNNNVEIKFVTPKRRDDINQHAKYIRLNNLKKYKDYSMGTLVKMVEDCHTSDGWIVMVTKKYY